VTTRNLGQTFQLEAESLFPPPSLTKSKMFLKLRNTAFSNIGNKAKLLAENEALYHKKTVLAISLNKQ